jgi:hypothetical protein
MKIYRGKKWGRLFINGEGALVISKNNEYVILLDKYIKRTTICNFNFYGLGRGFINKLKLIYIVVKFIFSKNIKEDKLNVSKG